MPPLLPFQQVHPSVVLMTLELVQQASNHHILEERSEDQFPEIPKPLDIWILSGLHKKIVQLHDVQIRVGSPESVPLVMAFPILLEMIQRPPGVAGTIHIAMSGSKDKENIIKMDDSNKSDSETEKKK
ncbi:hypothetical protein L208DRAFT_1382537 [Tricholoma matsutake]|nr:hypothetical protein L208DRAFT_1382537 [Tricholoma matsutake 945]